MDLLGLVIMLDYGLHAALALVGAGMVVWAMADAVRRPATKFENHSQQTKSTWLLILGAALIFGLGSAAAMIAAGMSFAATGDIRNLLASVSMFGLAAIVAAGVYLAGPKREFQMWSH